MLTSFLLRKATLHDARNYTRANDTLSSVAGQVAHRINGKAKAMIVTRSRLHAVRYKQAVDHYLREQDYPYKALVAFSGTIKDKGTEYTEAHMNGIKEAQAEY